MAKRTAAPANRRLNGATVKLVRQALGISQAALAARCEISAPTLSMYENGTAQPGAEVARRLAVELGADLDAITYPWPGEPVIEAAS